MEHSKNPLLHRFDWLIELGFNQAELKELNPCVPGEFTMPAALYVNTGSPGIVYRGTEEGTLPLVTGRWYLLTSNLVDRFPALRNDAVPVARAPRLVG